MSRSKNNHIIILCTNEVQFLKNNAKFEKFDLTNGGVGL